MSNAHTHEPPPQPGKQNVADMVLQDIQERVEAGRVKYGTLLQTHNGRDALMDAYQEAIDLVMYLRQAMLERDTAVTLRAQGEGAALDEHSATLEKYQSDLNKLSAALGHWGNLETSGGFVETVCAHIKHTRREVLGLAHQHIITLARAGEILGLTLREVREEARKYAESLGDAAPQPPQADAVAVSLRPEVLAFAQAMEAKLKLNDHKGGWKNCDYAWLYSRLLNETDELASEVVKDGENILSEAADVANFAMMVADVCGALATLRQEGEE